MHANAEPDLGMLAEKVCQAAGLERKLAVHARMSKPNSEPAYAPQRLDQLVPAGAEYKNRTVQGWSRRPSFSTGKPVQKLRPGSSNRPSSPSTVLGRRWPQHPGTPGLALAYATAETPTHPQIAASDNAMSALAKVSPTCRLLMCVPGKQR